MLDIKNEIFKPNSMPSLYAKKQAGREEDRPG